jgi:sigma-B regulation protein RsbU (phosphoserine phosphatase)
MRTNLKEYMQQLQTTTAAKERIEGELQIAHSIQMSLVPKTFPPFPNRTDFEIFADLEPAREIGGDFYDFFMPDENTLCLVIGDVSGKGVPAALFMAVTRTFLKALWRNQESPAVVLGRLNDELASDNDPNMFVTLFCATINLSNGQCRYARGGHNPPFILNTQGKARRVPWTKGAIIGVIEGTQLEEGEITLEPGDILFLYTDGVTEAMDPEGHVYGEEQTLESLEKFYTPNCHDLVLRMRETLLEYAHGAEQSDDITMLAFRYQGGFEGRTPCARTT